jgi:hypothetical protein
MSINQFPFLQDETPVTKQKEGSAVIVHSTRGRRDEAEEVTP